MDGAVRILCIRSVRGKRFLGNAKSRVDLLAGKRKANGVFKGKDHYLLEDIAKPDEDQMKENLSAMKMFQKQYKDIPMYMMLVPNAANIESDKLPGYAVTENQEKQFKAIHSTLGSVYTWVDVSDILKNTDQKKSIITQIITGQHLARITVIRLFQKHEA